MLFNIISILGFGISLLMIYLLTHYKWGFKVLKYLAVFMLVFKITEYIIMNLMGEVSYPIEISTITYFLFSIVIIFNIKKLFHVAAFFAIISGLGFFLYYSLFGFISAMVFEVPRHIIAVGFHGILLIGGSYLFIKNKFDKSQKMQLLMVMLLILSHGSIFYLDSIKGSTFIYFLVNPEFLQIFDSNLLNYSIMMIYYLIIFGIYLLLINKFYILNNMYHRNGLLFEKKVKLHIMK